MHTVQAYCTEVSGEKKHGGNAILTTKKTYAGGSLFIPPSKMSPNLEGGGQSVRLSELPLVG